MVEEVLSGIRTVFAFGGERIEVERYKKLLLPAENAARKKGAFAAAGDAVTRLLYFTSCAIASWVGTEWVMDDRDKEYKTYTTAVLTIVKLIFKYLIELSFNNLIKLFFPGFHKSTFKR